MIQPITVLAMLTTTLPTIMFITRAAIGLLKPETWQCSGLIAILLADRS